MPSESQLSGVLSEFARTMVTDFPIQDILEGLVERIVEILPISGAGVTLISESERPRYVAASDDAALRYEQLQTELGEGPCLAAYRTGSPIAVENLAVEDRFVVFASRAVREGLAAVFTFPLRHGDRPLGALDLYCDTPGALDEATMAAAQTLADVAAAYLLNAQARSDLTEASTWYQENSLHDPLTGLPNRMLLLERLEHALVRGRRTGRTLAVLFADLDRFKAVNDVHGHRIGDELLVAVARRISGVLREGDTLARLSGDEFVILCEDLTATSEADTIAGRLGEELRLPFVLSSTEVRLTASVGIAFAGQGDDLLPDQILHRADTAMYQAKRTGGGRHLILEADPQRGGHPGDLTEDLVGAASRGELGVVYQPIVAARDAQVVGVEALLRWAHPYRGPVPPAVFIPLAEQAGLITGIGRWVLEAAFRDKTMWAATGGGEPLGMSLNVSVHQLMSPDFAATVASVLARTSTEPEAITLELTESAFIRDSERALIVLTDLKKLGLSIALDDFGTGYSSLSLLNRFPVDVVKIDKSFVQELGTKRVSRAIVSAVIDLSHALGITVTAEGVETTEQYEELVALGCDNCQGYHFARPMSARDLVAAV